MTGRDAVRFAGVPYPNFAGKHAHDALLEPSTFVRYWTAQGVLPESFVAPEGVVVLYQRRLFDAVIQEADEELTRSSSAAKVCPGRKRPLNRPLASGLWASTPICVSCLSAGWCRYTTSAEAAAKIAVKSLCTAALARSFTAELG